MSRRDLLTWSAISALMLVPVSLVTVVGAVVYAQLALAGAPRFGVGPSQLAAVLVSVFVRAGGVALVSLLATALFWMLGLILVDGLAADLRTQRLVKTSLIVVPLIFFSAYSLARLAR